MILSHNSVHISLVLNIWLS